MNRPQLLHLHDQYTGVNNIIVFRLLCNRVRNGRRVKNVEFSLTRIGPSFLPLKLANYPIEIDVYSITLDHNPLYSNVSPPYKELTIVYDDFHRYFSANLGRVDNTGF